jgi:hypothetical protein
MRRFERCAMNWTAIGFFLLAALALLGSPGFGIARSLR